LTARYGDFQPANIKQRRYSDEQLYALALYLYSLEPPPNPNPVDEIARRGQHIFEQQGCSGCHTPPLYTNNRLTPAAGFQIPEQLQTSDQILDVCAGTDSALALRSRRGTGFYKVPSLRGVWYRNAFGHMGQAETLEEWFDPARLNLDYTPKGFHLGRGPIRGHEFGLNLPIGDRAALIAFLRTL
jgi:cytochrome c peroxidase